MTDPSRIRRTNGVARIEFNLPDCGSSAVWESGTTADEKLRSAIKAARKAFFKHWNAPEKTDDPKERP